jgi:hypothetical protein
MSIALFDKAPDERYIWSKEDPRVKFIRPLWEAKIRSEAFALAVHEVTVSLSFVQSTSDRNA